MTDKRPIDPADQPAVDAKRRKAPKQSAPVHEDDGEGYDAVDHGQDSYPIEHAVELEADARSRAELAGLA